MAGGRRRAGRDLSGAPDLGAANFRSHGALYHKSGYLDKGEITPKMMGIMAGQVVASSKAFIPKAPGEKAASPAVKMGIREARRFMKGMRPFLRQIDESFRKHADSLSLVDESAFYQAKAETLKRNSKGVGFWESSNTRLYIALLFLWPYMARIRSVRELHTILCGIMGKSVVGDIKRVEAICRRIKLKFGPPGRPKIRPSSVKPDPSKSRRRKS